MTNALIEEPTQAIAVAIVTELTKLAWPADVAFRYVAVPELDALDVGKEVHILIGGEGTETERSSRGATGETSTVAFGVRARCKPDELEKFWRLQSIAYTVGRQILQLKRTAIGATPMIARMNVSHDIDKLRTGEFLSVRTVELDVRRRLAG